MKLLFTILLNAVILYILAYLFPFENSSGVRVTSLDLESAWYIYVLGGVVIVFLQSLLTPIIKAVGFPLKVMGFWIASFVLNFVIVWGLLWILRELDVSDVEFTIHGMKTWILVVAVVSLFHTFHNTFLR